MTLARPWFIATAVAAASAVLALAPAARADAQPAAGPAGVAPSRACPPAGFAVSFSATQFTRVLNLLVKLP